MYNKPIMAHKGKPREGKSFLEKVVTWGIIGIFALLPLLYFSDRAASYVTSKQYFLIGTVDILAVLWVWLLLVDIRYRLVKKNMFFLVPLFLFLLSMTVSGFSGADPATSFFSTVESGTGLVLLYHAFVLTCIIASLLRVQQKKLLTYILQANVFASAILAGATFFTGDHGIWDIGSKMLNGSSGGAMMGNSLLVGAYFIFSIFLTLYLILQEQQAYKKTLYWLVIALMVLSPIYLNAGIFKGIEITSAVHLIGHARIAAVSLIVGLFISLCIWLALRDEKKVWKYAGIGGLFATVFFGIYIGVQLITPQSLLQQFFITESGNRITDWKASIQGIAEKPLLGWGPENFNVVYQKYLDPIVFDPGHGNEVWALHPHNNTLEVAVNGGIVGLLLYLAIFGGLFVGIVSLYKKQVFDKATVSLLAGMLIAFMLQQQMIYESIVSYTMLFFIVAIVAGFSAASDQQKHFKYIGRREYVIGAIAFLVFFPVWLYGAFYPARKTEEFQQVVDAHSDARAVRYQHLFHSAGSYAISTDAEFYTDPLFFSYYPQREVLKNNPVYQKIASEELTALFKAVDPIWQKDRYNYHLSLSLLQLANLQYYLTGDKELLAKADTYAQRAFKLSPADPQIYFYYAQTLAYENNNEEAKSLLDQAIALNANYTAAVEYRKLFK